MPIPGPVSPDGIHFVYASHDSLFIASLENQARRFLTTGRELHSYSWSTVGRWIAFVSGNVGTSAGRVDWSGDGRRLFYPSSDSTGATTLYAIPATGGTPRVVVRFDDPTRPWHRYGLRERGSRLYFTLGDLQSDSWVADLEER